MLPRLTKLVAGDDSSYRYLAESIRMHPGQDELKALMQQSGFGHVDYHNMTGVLPRCMSELNADAQSILDNYQHFGVTP